MTDTLLLPAAVYAIHGYLSSAEADLLYRLASAMPKGGVGVEIGNFKGKSTIAIGLGAKQAGAWVWSIDPHEDFQVTPETHYGMENHAALLRNLVDFEVVDVVRVVALESMQTFEGWSRDIDLLWIDGCHEYQSIHYDLMNWSCHVRTGVIAVHDTSGHFPDVTRALTEFLAGGKWILSEQVDATAVLRRAK